ncbi:homocysteine S-methyltransferase [Marininema halotolerans]|uniref:Homocysteine S-methyltransferase n=2 Tax=Marininema halotolerans TaxID=1155944 RepID=A0A1I6NTS5_9BACL|nr:homocysteine S-methyltransferase [Marininema halotolerans]
MKEKPDLRKALSQSILVGDGAMSTYLYQQGIPVGVSVEELCLSRPDWVEEVHRSYYEAGAQVIETNTYGANRERLTRYGMEGKITRINREAVRIARNSVGEDAYVIGTIGSINAGRVPNYDPREYRDMYEEQATALLYSDVDGITLETFLDLEELLLSLEEIRTLTSTPIFANLALIEVGQTRDGYPLTEAFAALEKAGADGVGLNCRLGPLEIQRALERTIVPEDVWLTAYPNAGRLGQTDGQFQYKSTPAYFGERALSFREQGVRLIGGCCGTTPEHVHEIRNRLRGLSPLSRVNPSTVPTIQERSHEQIQVRNPPTVVDKARKGTTIIIEFDPPKDLEIADFLAGARELDKAGADAITLADNSMATVRMSNMALGSIMKEKTGAEPLVHITCRDRNLIGQQSHLMGLHALGMDQILVITGDPTRIGDLPGSSSIYDVNSFDLIRMVKQLNEGISFSGKPLKQKARFTVGAAFNPNVSKMDAAIRRLERKVEAGADFIMTQPVYDAASIRHVAEATKGVDIPIFLGIMPLTSYRNALFLHNELPGVKIPTHVLEEMTEQKGEEARRIGIAQAKELLDEATRYFNGIYLITPFNYWEMTAELTRYIRQKTNSLQVAY